MQKNKMNPDLPEKPGKKPLTNSELNAKRTPNSIEEKTQHTRQLVTASGNGTFHVGQVLGNQWKRGSRLTHQPQPPRYVNIGVNPRINRFIVMRQLNIEECLIFVFKWKQQIVKSIT